jgi:hypothetical protein
MRLDRSDSSLHPTLLTTLLSFSFHSDFMYPLGAEAQIFSSTWIVPRDYPTITYYWTAPLILDHSYLVGNLTNSKIAETKALEPLKS